MKSRHVAFVVAMGCILIALSATARTPLKKAKKVRLPPAEPLESQSIPKEKSSRPTIEEWQNATPIAVTRRGADANICHAFRVREWLKVKCDMNVAAIRQHGGNSENVFFWIGVNPEVDRDYINGGEAMFPMHPGDQRVIEFYRLIPEMCFGREASPWILVDETWVEGDASPTVVIR